MQPEGFVLAEEAERTTGQCALRAYLLGRVDWHAVLSWQTSLVAEAFRTGQASVILCEHSPLISVGRHGSYRHVLLDMEELQRRFWPVYWVNRGGGCWLHMPGQLASYLVVPLGQRHLAVATFLERIQKALAAVVSHYLLPAELLPESMEVRVRGRPIACIGIHVRRGISSFGAILNIGPDLTCYRWVRTGYANHSGLRTAGTLSPPMTSLERECRRSIRPAEVRELLLRHLADQLQYCTVSIFLEPPRLTGKVMSSARFASR